MAGSEEEERLREREAGLGGEGSKVWEMVVVAVTMEVRRWVMSVSGGLRGRLEDVGWAAEEEVEEEEVEVEGG